MAAETKPRVLVVDDSPDYVVAVKTVLGGDYEVETVLSGEDALDRLDGFNPDVVVLDVNLGPGRMDGFETCAQIRDRSDCVILMLTGSTEEEAELRGFENGADDYISKARLATLKSRMKLAEQRTVRRTQTTAPATAESTPTASDAGDDETTSVIRFDEENGVVYLDHQPIPVTRMQMSALKVLGTSEPPGTEIPREAFRVAIWPEQSIDEIGSRLDTLISDLRKLLRQHESQFSIKTVHGFGYRFSAHDAAAVG